MSLLSTLTDAELDTEATAADAHHDAMISAHGARAYYPSPNINGRHPEVENARTYRNSVHNEIFARSVFRPVAQL